MQPYKKQFIRLAIDYQVLRFGEFTLKSGRVSPYFFNAGLFNSGRALARLGDAYAQAVIDYELEFDVLFGPAYKGIPLVSALAIALSRHHDIDKPYAFNRKEAKSHGEGGVIVGAPVRGRVLVVDDVITAGTAIRESFEMISAHNATVSAVLIALDRQERGRGEHSAIQEIEKEFGISVYSIITLNDLIEYLADDKQLLNHLDAMRAYRDQYGV